MTKEEILQYIKSELVNENAEIYLDVDDYKIIVEALEQKSKFEMRDATPEERESIDRYIKSISKPTKVDFWESEKEPFINKACCISSEVCEHDKIETLDKIRAEIVKKHLSIVEKNDFDSGRTYGYEEVLDIIDKYRAEMESEWKC